MTTKFSQALAAMAALAGDAAASTFNTLWACRNAATDETCMSQAAVAARRGVCERTIRRHTRRLQKIGRVVVKYEHDPETGYGTAIRYKLLLEVGAQLAAIVAELAGRSQRAAARAMRRAEALERFRLPTGQFGPRSISPEKLERWMQPFEVTGNLLRNLGLQKSDPGSAPGR